MTEEGMDKSLPRRSLVMPNIDLRDVFVNRFHKLITDSYIVLCRSIRLLQQTELNILNETNVKNYCFL